MTDEVALTDERFTTKDGKAMATSNRRVGGPLLPRLEALEDRWMPAVVIGGYVHEDCNANGLFESTVVGTRGSATADEVGLGGVTLQLLDSSNQVIATTVTDGSGHYQFTQRDNVSTTPVELAYDATFGQAKTDLDRIAALKQFDPTYGTLQSIQITAEGSVFSQAQLENLEAAAAAMHVELHGHIQYSVPGVSTPIDSRIDKVVEGTLGAFDGQADLQGTSASDFGTTQLQGSFDAVTITDPNAMAAFVGTGDVSVRQSADVTSSASGTGNLLAMVRSMAAGKVHVVYRYTPSNQITPGQYTIQELGPISGYNDGLDTSTNVTAIPNSDTTDQIPVTVSTANDVLTNNHFGEMLQAHLLGRVYHDVDVSGSLTGGDVGLQLVTIQLTGTDAFGHAVSQTTSTDGLGYYAFRGLTRGTYTLTELQPAGYQQGTNTLGTAGGTQSGDSFTVTLDCGQVGDNYYFGEILGTPDVPLPPPPPDTFDPTPPAPPPTPPAPPPSSPQSILSKFFLLGSSWLDM
jgi:hypothetical protein